MKKFLLSIITVFTFICAFTLPASAKKNEINSVPPATEVRAVPVEKVPFSYTHSFDRNKTQTTTIQIIVEVRSTGSAYITSYKDGAGNCSITNVKGGTARIVSEGYSYDTYGILNVVIGFKFTSGATGKTTTYNMTFKVRDKYLQNVTVYAANE